MNTELEEALSALLDGEVPPHDVLRRALAQPDAIATLLGLLEVRAVLQTGAVPGPAAVEATGVAMMRAGEDLPGKRSRSPGRSIARTLRWGAGATLVLVFGASVSAGVAAIRRSHTEPDGPPAADLIARFPFQPQRDSDQTEVMP